MRSRNHLTWAESGWYRCQIQANSTIMVRRRALPALPIPCSRSTPPLLYGVAVSAIAVDGSHQCFDRRLNGPFILDVCEARHLSGQYPFRVAELNRENERLIVIRRDKNRMRIKSLFHR